MFQSKKGNKTLFHVDINKAYEEWNILFLISQDV